ncbi:MAG: hypothetical protein AAF902_10075 [Chloroflexota bacterium]
MINPPKKLKYYYLNVIVIVMISIMAISCASDSDPVTDVNTLSITEGASVEAPITPTKVPTTLASTTVPTPTAMSTVDLVNTATSNPTSTKTQAITPSATAKLTVTPLPTMQIEMIGKAYTDLIMDNQECILPCWWGIVPGITQSDIVDQIYTSLGQELEYLKLDESSALTEITFTNTSVEGGIPIRHIYAMNENIVTNIEVNAGFAPNYQIKPLIERLGPPSEILLWTFSDSYEGLLPAYFQLYFPEKSVIVAYTISGDTSNEETNKICFDQEGETLLFLWSEIAEDIGFIERSAQSIRLRDLSEFKAIQDISSWDVDQFVENVTDPSNDLCLETPTNLWKAPWE